MSVEDLLAGQRSEVLDEAYAGLAALHTAHYERSGEQFTRERLAELFDVVLVALGERQLTGIGEYAERVAEQRFAAGFGIAEVQSAFNVLEQAIWRRVVADVAPEDLAEAIGLVGTILGHGKDALARRYVSLASQRHVPSLDLTALFGHVEG